MFAGAQVGNLRELRLTSCSGVQRSALMPPECVQQMVDACPHLQVLQLGGEYLLSGFSDNELREGPPEPPVSLLPLAQLQHLMRLRVYSMRSQVCCGNCYCCCEYLLPGRSPFIPPAVSSTVESANAQVTSVIQVTYVVQGCCK
jgi:hypothetical protein